MQTLFGSGDSSVPTCTCPACDLPIRVEDINEDSDTACCRYCRTTYRSSGLHQQGPSFEYLLSHPPEGATLEWMPSGFVATASTRSAYCWMAVPILLGCIVLPMGALLNTGSLQTPNKVTDLLFLVVFLLFGCSTAVRFAILAFGHVEVTNFGDQCAIFDGVGSIGRTRRFQWSEVRSVAEIVAGSGRNKNPPDRDQLPVKIEAPPAFWRESLRRAPLVPARGAAIAASETVVKAVTAPARSCTRVRPSRTAPSRGYA